MTASTPLPTPAELRDDADTLPPNTPANVRRKAALRAFATLIEESERGVTDEVVERALVAYGYRLCNANNPHPSIFRSMRAALVEVAPHLAQTKDQP